MIEQIETGSPKILGYRFSGKLHDEDYQTLVPAIDAAVAAEGKVRLLMELHDFHGWDPHAAWDDLKLGIKHYSHFERIAIVGEKKWEEWMVILGKPFMGSSLRYFDAAEAETAREWIRENL